MGKGLLWILLLFSPLAAADPLHILAVGDSITQGGTTSKPEPEYTYRLPLQRMLAGLGVQYDFVGTRNTGRDNLAWPAGFDPDHEGYYNKTTAYVSEAMPPVATDIALIHLGTNDSSRWNVWEAIVVPLEAIVVKLRTQNPRVAIFITEPAIGGVRSRLRHLALSRLAQRLNTAKSPVVFVPRPATWDPALDTFEGVHPNARGSMKLALAWLEAITEVMAPDPTGQLAMAHRK